MTMMDLLAASAFTARKTIIIVSRSVRCSYLLLISLRLCRVRAR